MEGASEQTSENAYKIVEIPNLDPEIDVGNLLAVDITPLEEKDPRSSQEHYLKILAIRNIQHLINKVWDLPTERVEDAVVAKLPKGTTIIPRAKPIPKPKPPTRWEQYAKEKGIHKLKKDNLVWDETDKTWKPRYGYRRVNNPKDDWMVEVPENSDPNTDVFQQKAEERKERISKNEFQRLRNIARSQKIKLPNNELVQGDKPTRKQLSQSIVHAKKSTASIGKFKESLADNQQPKEQGKKRKFQSNFGNLTEERNNSLKILENLHKKKPKLDVTKAVNFQDVQEQSTGGNKRGKGSSSKEGKNRSKSFIKKKQQRQQKSQQQKGQRNSKKRR